MVDMIHIVVDRIVFSLAKVRFCIADATNVDYCTILFSGNGHSVLAYRQVNVEVARKDELEL